MTNDGAYITLASCPARSPATVIKMMQRRQWTEPSGRL